ncbi:hypothetical protein BY996DRAFT_6420679 [Phakopsora pachyrhizi]|nr:hypothetical protein BY996DRAFT_6420679 [Phakopsora pachyrhizi]
MAITSESHSSWDGLNKQLQSKHSSSSSCSLGNSNNYPPPLRLASTISNREFAFEADSDTVSVSSTPASSLRDTYKDLIKSSERYSPCNLIHTLRSYALQFAQQTQGHFSQQDAEDCWVQIFTAIRSTLDNSTGINKKFGEQYMTQEITTKYSKHVKQYPRSRYNWSTLLTEDLRTGKGSVHDHHPGLHHQLVHQDPGSEL